MSTVSTYGRLRAIPGIGVTSEYDSNRPVSLAGVSFGWSQWEAAPYYNRGVVLHLVKDWRAQVVRCALGVHQDDDGEPTPGSFLVDPEPNRDRVYAVIDAAIEAGVYVVVDWHDHQALEHEAAAIAFFEAVAARYGSHHPNVIYEVFNEPLRGVPWAAIKAYALNVVAAIRRIDAHNLIVVGTPTWYHRAKLSLIHI